MGGSCLAGKRELKRRRSVLSFGGVQVEEVEVEVEEVLFFLPVLI